MQRGGVSRRCEVWTSLSRELPGLASGWRHSPGRSMKFALAGEFAAEADLNDQEADGSVASTLRAAVASAEFGCSFSVSSSARRARTESPACVCASPR